MTRLESYIDQTLLSIVVLAQQGKALTVNALRHGLAQELMNAEGYTVSEEDLDVVTMLVAMGVLATGLVDERDGVFYPVTIASNGPTTAPVVSEDELN